MKKEPMEDADLDREPWLGPMLRQSPMTASGACVDAETLAAWSEGALDARQSVLVEQHASNCSRCMAMIASIERARPEVETPPKPAWGFGPLLRWGVPLTAAATAIAIWVMVPNRSLTRPEPMAARQDSSASVAVPAPPAVPEPAPGREQEQFAPKLESVPTSPDSNAAAAPPPAPSENKQVAETPVEGALARENVGLRDEEKRREQAALDALSARGRSRQDQDQSASAAPAAKSAAAPSAAAPPAAPTPTMLNETVAIAPGQPSTLPQGIPSSESTAPSNALIRWRVIAWVSVERSIDGGNTWIKTAVPPGVAPNYMPALTLVAIRAVDSLRAVVQASDGTTLYTTNGGVSWERVQGNSAAPF